MRGDLLHWLIWSETELFQNDHLDISRRAREPVVIHPKKVEFSEPGGPRWSLSLKWKIWELPRELCTYSICFLFHLGSQSIGWCTHIYKSVFTSVQWPTWQSFTEKHSQTHPEVCFTNFYNQVDKDYPSHLSTLNSR